MDYLKKEDSDTSNPIPDDQDSLHRNSDQNNDHEEDSTDAYAYIKRETDLGVDPANHKPRNHFDIDEDDIELSNSDQELDSLRKEVQQVNDELNSEVAHKFDDDAEWAENDADPKDNRQSYHRISESNQRLQSNLPQNENSPKSATKKRSKLVDNYFGGGGDKSKKKNSKASKGPATHERPSRGQFDDLEYTKDEEEEIVKRYVNERIDKLNQEVARFTMENERVSKMRQKENEGMKALQKEKEEFIRYKEDEMAKLEEYKDEEVKKMKREKKIAERNQKAISGMPNRKERDEIEN